MAVGGWTRGELTDRHRHYSAHDIEGSTRRWHDEPEAMRALLVDTPWPATIESSSPPTW